MSQTLEAYLALGQYRATFLTEMITRGYRWPGIKPVLYSLVRGDDIVVTKPAMQDDIISANKAALEACRQPGLRLALVEIRSQKRRTSLAGGSTPNAHQ